MDSIGYNNLNSYLLLHGHTKELRDIVIDDHLKSVIKELSDIPLDSLYGGSVAFIKKDKMRRDAIEYLRYYFSLHEVGYLSNKVLLKLMKNPHIKTHLDIPFYYNSSAKMVDPFQIPIEYSQNSIFAGSLCTQTLITEDEDWIDIILPELNVYFSHISLPKTITSIATTSYIHEVVHTQLESQKGVVEDYYHAEILSIFIELLHTYESSITNYKIDLVNRIENILANFYSIFLYQTGQIEKIHDPNYSVCSYHRDIQYFYSIFIAFHLFRIYQESSKSVKKEMLQMIQNVFDGEIYLEEFLSLYSSDEESSINGEDAKKLVKRIKE